MRERTCQYILHNNHEDTGSGTELSLSLTHTQTQNDEGRGEGISEIILIFISNKTGVS